MTTRSGPLLLSLVLSACLTPGVDLGAEATPDAGLRGDADAPDHGQPAGPDPDEVLPPDDLRGYVPSKPFIGGRGRPFPEGMSRKPLGADVIFDPCTNPIPPLVHARLSPQVDGSLADWQGRGLVALDRRGDGIHQEPGRDLRALRMAEDDQHLYLGAELYGPWPTTPGDRMLLLVILQDLAERDDGYPDSDGRRRRVFLVLQGGSLWEERGHLDGKSGPVAPDLGSAAIRGRHVELRLRRSALPELSATYAVNVHLWDDSGSDSLGSYVAGYPADYGCLITLPDGTFMTSTFLRNPAVPREKADVIYRAFIAAVPETARALGRAARRYDTVNLLIPQRLLAGGAYGVQIGVMALPLVADLPPPYSFGLMAHEAAHLVNYADYSIFALWAGEGHSEMARMRAVEGYFGPVVREDELRQRRALMTDAETRGGVIPLDVQPWPMDGFVRYSKAAVLMYGVSELLDQEALAELLDPAPSGRRSGFSSAELRQRLAAAILLHRGVTTGWQGWIVPGPYDGTPFPPPR